MTADKRERLRRIAIRRCAECLELLDKPITEDQFRAAAEHLGRTDLLPEPQREMTLVREDVV